MMKRNEWQATLRRVSTTSQGQMDATYLLANMTQEQRQDALKTLTSGLLKEGVSNCQIIVVRF